MSDWTLGWDLAHPKDDPRSVNELIASALSEPDEFPAWNAIWVLHGRGTQEVLDEAARLCRSFCIVERSLGAEILAQLGAPGRTFPEECVRLLLDLLSQEREPEVLRSTLVALGHYRTPEVVVRISRFRRHKDGRVRDGVVFALLESVDPRAIDALIKLTTDEDPHVRDWATFGLGTQVDLDMPVIREALAARLYDADADTRGEAMLGLVRRGDPRVLPALHRSLDTDSISTMAIEAAFKVGAPDLHPQLVALQGRWDVDKNLLEDAIRACLPRTEGMG
ncbi:MAG: hypothetical protein ACLQGP_06345 [Isosphaeraceae bacterium]